MKKKWKRILKKVLTEIKTFPNKSDREKKRKEKEKKRKRKGQEKEKKD